MENLENKIHPVLVGFFTIACIMAAFFIFIFSIIFFIENKNNLNISKDSIAIIEISGIITESSDIIRQIKKYRKSKSVKGVLLRINSPGGAVAPSQEIYEEVLNLKKYNKKVVSSLGTLAASGGYYIACASDKIVANPGTITGSIGVIINLSDMTDLMKKIGIKSNVIKSGKYKDIGSPGRQMTTEDKAVFQSVVDDVYNQFVDAVAAGRQLNKDEVIKLSTGQIFSGNQAKKNGLVDHIGNQERAIEYLAELVNIKGEPHIIREPKERWLLSKLFSYFTTSFPFTSPPSINKFSIQYLLPY